MKLGTIFNLGKVVFGVCTGDPVMIWTGVTGAVKSSIMSTVTEPIKDAVCDKLGDTDWVEVAETCSSW